MYTLDRRPAGTTSDDALFANLRAVWDALGHAPCIDDMHSERGLSRYSDGAYRRRFGSWRKALEAFVTWANRTPADGPGDGVEVSAATVAEPMKAADIAAYAARVSSDVSRIKRAQTPVRAPVEPPLEPADNRSRLVVIFNDIHIPTHDRRVWAAACEFMHAMRGRIPLFVLLGDIVDLASVSTHLKTMDTNVSAIYEIKEAVRELTPLIECADRTVFVEGNHDERYFKALLGDKAMLFRDALGLTLKDQFYAHGLDPRVEWMRETSATPVLKVGQFDLTHGHNSTSRFGGGKHVAANRITKTMGASTLQGHVHVSQMFCQTYLDRTAISITSGCMQALQDYSTTPNWQHGFTILELDAPDYTRATPHPIVMERGRFSWGGRTYGVAA